MRVIAGSARSMPLKTLPGFETRPTTDRIKETLFNMLQPELCQSRFLDLFAGSGGIGIEALSRGAEACVFVEKNRKAVKIIEENLTFTKLSERAEVYAADVFHALRSLEGAEPFDCIFMDPPYGQDLEKKVLELLRSASYVTEHTRIIIEASLQTTFDDLAAYGFVLEKEKRYKTNMHIFIRKA